MDAMLAGKESHLIQIVTLVRGQIGKKPGLDTTVKSAPAWLKPLIPTWKMVLDHKERITSDEDYVRDYLRILRRTTKEFWREVYRSGLETENRVTLLCYCRDGWFCHTHLIITYATMTYPKAFGDGRRSLNSWDHILIRLMKEDDG